MFARLLFESFRRQQRRKAFALLAIALGMSITTAMIAVATDVGDKMNQELRTQSANLLITPVQDSLDVNIGGVNLKPASEGAYIRESDLPKMKDIFWGHNILGFAPFLSEQQSFVLNPHVTAESGDVHVGSLVTADLIGTYFSQELKTRNESFVTGVQTVNKFWQVQGQWPADDSTNALAGSSFAAKANLHPGDTIAVGGRTLTITGILTTGGPEDEAIVAPLHLVQQLLGHPDQVRRVVVSALTKPEDDFARRDPRSMSPTMFERWSCSPYANSIAFQIHDALPNVQVEQIRQVEQNQGRVLARISGLLLLLTIAALVAAGLAVSAVMAATIIERRHEVGLMKSLGAGNGAVASLFLTEAGLLALAGGFAGFAIGVVLAHRIGQSIFGSSITVHPVVLAIVVFAALVVALAGSTGAVRKAMRFDPALVLRGDA
ncbi:MAG TPA: ABC transporter permease [Candidatus Angelobacter sp.]|nr:ABC transporter permease [Candidatus Angelobacter sp.]